MSRFWSERAVWFLLVIIILLAACAGPAATDATEDVTQTATTVPPPTETPQPPQPTETAVPEDTSTPEPTASPEPTVTEMPAEPTAVPDPIFPIGSTANWTDTNDAIGIEGEIEFTSATQLVVRNFVFLAAEAPGVDIRLGVGDDFSDGVGVSLRDITGKTYEGRSLTLTIPPAAFDGRTFDSIGVFCFDTGDLFDYALVQTDS